MHQLFKDKGFVQKSATTIAEQRRVLDAKYRLKGSNPFAPKSHFMDVVGAFSAIAFFVVIMLCWCGMPRSRRRRFGG
jgi:hypothetical protein